jgi:hypothetical protein
VNSRNPLALAILSTLALELTACSAIQSIFKAGFWVGAFGVAAVAVLVFLTLSLLRR